MEGDRLLYNPFQNSTFQILSALFRWFSTIKSNIQAFGYKHFQHFFIDYYFGHLSYFLELAHVAVSAFELIQSAIDDADGVLASGVKFCARLQCLPQGFNDGPGLFADFV